MQERAVGVVLDRHLTAKLLLRSAQFEKRLREDFEHGPEPLHRGRDVERTPAFVELSASQATEPVLKLRHGGARSADMERLEHLSELAFAAELWITTLQLGELGISALVRQAFELL